MSEKPASAPRIVRCPQCGKPVPWVPESQWRPFCSERCRTLDLGGWLSERYRIGTPERSDDAAEPPQPDSPDESGRY